MTTDNDSGKMKLVDHDDAPELTDAFFSASTIRGGENIVRQRQSECAGLGGNVGMTNYIAIIHKDPHSDFGVSFPDFPGCVTAGGTLAKAHAMAYEALTFHIEGMIEEGCDIPAPSSFKTIMRDPNNESGMAFIVRVKLSED
ncbi:MAG: type II toxin-antitoxin system HicB family antitoxin [Gluconobacter cerinus]|uniref:type II toxin-antitoxin system HicB family antitoxin n=1 Tax=Gluconobacter cerinus TaxID=38307 RepID=UPI0039EA16DC